MKFIKLLRKHMDADDNVYEVGSVLEVSDDIATSLIKEAKAEEHDGVIKEIKAEDVAVAVKDAVASAMKEVKTASIDVKDVKSNIEVVEDAPLFKSTGEFLNAVKGIALGDRDERLFKSTGQAEAVDADGGYLVEHRLGKEIYKVAAQNSILLPKCSTLEIGPNSNGMKINQVNESARSATTLFGGVRVYSPGEGVAKTAFKQAYTQKDLSLGKLCAVNYMTDELMADVIALKSQIRNDVGSSFAWAIDDDIIHGTTNTAMQEIENNAATVRYALAGNNPTAAELFGMFKSMLPGSIGRAEWYMSISQYTAISQLETTAGQRLVVPNYVISPYGVLLGRPINIIEQADVSSNDTSIMFLDLSQYLVIKKGGIDEVSSIHVKFLEDETAFRWTMRMGGAPKIASAITLPDNSIVAPFVTRG